MNKRLLIIILLASACSSPKSGREAAVDVDGVSFKPIQCERLANLNIPRSGHAVLSMNGELTVFGGHTTGFVPTATAEYLSDGSWHETAPMHYPHDNGFALQTAPDSVMLGGGHESFGIDQTWGVEVYSAKDHRFTPLCILDRKRTLPSAVELSDGRILVSGNWYAPDAIGLYTPGKGFEDGKPLPFGGPKPYLLPTEDGNVLIINSLDIYGAKLPAVVERLHGDAFTPAVFEEWEPIGYSQSGSAEKSRIGKGTYLIPVLRKADGQCGILRVSGEDFSLLPTEQLIPMRSPDGADIIYGPTILADTGSREAYLCGVGKEHRIYILKISYDATLVGGKASLEMYWTPEADELFPVDFDALLLSGGRIAAIGGMVSDNFNPSGAAFILHTVPPAKTNSSLWWILAAALVLLVATEEIIRRSGKNTEEAAQAPAPKAESDLMARIRAQMEEEQLFRRKGLTKGDLAGILGTNVTYVSACINTQFGKSFPDFVADYRIRFAQKLMKEHPDMLLAEVSDESGFANEQSFFRSFKAVTGLTPQEWKIKNNQ